MFRAARPRATAAVLVALTACGTDAPVGPDGPAPAEAAVVATAGFPAVIPLPVAPEGIAIGNGTTFYVGALRGGATGGILRGNLRTGEVERVYTDTRGTLGLAFDARSGYLFAARGSTGFATVLDAATGAVVADLQVATAPPGTFVNDVVVTRTAAYFTDSFRPVLYRVPLSAAGALQGGFGVVALTGDFQQAAPSGPAPQTCTGIPGPFSANGIEATPDGRWLIVNTLARGELYRVDPTTGETRRIDLGGADVCLADGNVLVGRTLYVMQNMLGRMAVVALSSDYLSGTVQRHITGTHPMTTMKRFGDAIFAVTAGFGSLDASGQPWQVVKLGM